MNNSIINKLIFLIFFLINTSVSAKEFIIEGNEFTDDNILLSIIDKVPDIDEKSQSNYILKKLISSNLFKSVEVSYDINNFFINIIEYPSINKFIYNNNERIKDEDIDNIVNELELYTLSESKINNLIEELSNIYQSFGYNNIQIQFIQESSIINFVLYIVAVNAPPDSVALSIMFVSCRSKVVCPKSNFISLELAKFSEPITNLVP